MTTHIDPNAQHAVYAPSSAHRWTVCTASAEAIAHLPEQEEGEEAAKGTAAHEEIERCLMGSSYVTDGLHPLPVDPDHPSAYGVALVLAYVEKLWAQTAPTGGKMWIEQRVALTDQIWGRCDVAHWDDATSTLTIVDYKDGFVGVDAEENEQLRIYAAASIFTHHLPAKWIRYAVVQPNDFRPVPRVKQWSESADALYAWANDVALIPTRPKRFVAGEQCTYCPLFGRCDASKDLLAHLAPMIANPPDEIPAAQWALFKACEKPVTDWFKNADKAQTKRALTKGAPDGMKMVTATKHKAWKDPEAARRLVLERLGADGLDVPTPAQAIERGIPEDVVNAMAPRPDGSPVLAFANDKRPEWRTKSAAEMFAGVTTRA